jgi:hypothetical protein
MNREEHNERVPAVVDHIEARSSDGPDIGSRRGAEG